MENVNVMARICLPMFKPERSSEKLNSDFYEDEMEKLDEELYEEIAPKVCDAVSGFVSLAKERFTVAERNRLLDTLESLEHLDDGDAALDFLYGMFVAAGLKEPAKAVLDAIRIGDEYPMAYVLFMEDFFEDDDIDGYLIASWLMAEGE